MAAANDVLGRPAVLENVVQGVVPLDLRLTTLPDNEHDALFVLSEVPANRAVEFHCALRGVSVPRAYLEALRQVGDFRLSTFFLRSGAMRGATMSLLWSREAGLWRIISYELEAAVGLVPDLRSQVLEPRSRGAETLQGDPDFVGTNTEFLNAWIVEKDYTKALGFVSTKGYPCVGLFDDNDPASGGSNESVLPLRNGLQGVAEFVGAVDKHRLGDAIEGVLPRAEELRILAQSTDAYTLLSIPDDVAQSLSCMTPLAERQPIVSRGAPQYDNYYATSFRLRLVGEEPDAAFLVWAKENGEWRIVAFDLVTN
jgi:hypothetical protein